jgi:hypothetical protein
MMNRYSLFRRIRRQTMPNGINEKREQVRNHRDEQHELGKLLPAPGSLEVFAPEPDDGGGNRQRDDIILDQRAGQESPGEFDGCGWD